MRLIDADRLKDAIYTDFWEHFTQYHDSDQTALIDMVMYDIDEMPTFTPFNELPTRELVEKAWTGCDLCLDDSWERRLMIPKRFDHTTLLSCELALFCPGCGRPLTDRAVDIMMDRLDKLKDADD